MARPAPKMCPQEMALLVDNGSLRSEAVLAFRVLAARLSCASGIIVRPVSALHADRIDAAQLHNRPAEILSQVLERYPRRNYLSYTIVPLFFGPSRMLSHSIPRTIAECRQRFPHIRIRMAPPLVSPHDDSAQVLAQMLVERVSEVLTREGRSAAPVILLDHGTPVRAVNHIRNDLARRMGQLMGQGASAVLPASMERREGPNYRFNEPLVEDLLSGGRFERGLLILSLLFLFPGRHAGPGGDIEQICDRVRGRQPKLRIIQTVPLGSSPALTKILARRLIETEAMVEA